MSVYLRAHDVSLELPCDEQRDAGGGGLLSSLSGAQRRYRHVLRDIGFSAQEGDRVGIVGLNGAGKTTLLRVLNGAFPPSSGRVERKGSVQSLLNPTLGFAEYATVAENVILRGTAMGLRRRQIEPVLADVLRFAGLSDRASQRLHTLSSGQRMRLGFAISTAVQPDILVMDEWLSTGDAAFVGRAQERMSGRFDNARIVVMASHNTGLIRRLCNKTLVLHDGRARYAGDTQAALECYRDIVAAAGAELRAQAEQHDPLLFGDVVGAVDRVHRIGPRLRIEGWAIDGRGAQAALLRVDVAGAVHCFDAFERKDREDVNRYTGKRGAFGFVVEVPLEDGVVLHPIAERLTVTAGADAKRMGAPLRYAVAGVFEV